MKDNRILWVILGVLGVLVVAILANQGDSDSGNQGDSDSGVSGIYDNLPFEYGQIIPEETDCGTLQEIFDAADNAHGGRIDAGDLDMARAFTRTMEAADHRMREVGCYG